MVELDSKKQDSIVELILGLDSEKLGVKSLQPTYTGVLSRWLCRFLE